MVLVTAGLAGLAKGYDAPCPCFLYWGDVVWSFLYLALGHVLELILLCCRSTEAMESRSSCCVTNSRSCVASIHSPDCSPRIAPCLRR
jgi:hypothetical protein